MNQALKGLDGRYTLYHYKTPISHLLIGPAGVWALSPRNQRGTITYRNGRWRQAGGGIIASYLKLFAQEGLGRPDLEMQNDFDRLEKYLKKVTGDENIPPINGALVFTSDKAVIDIPEDSEQPPIPTMQLGKLKEHLRKFTKSKPISLDKAQEIQKLISGQSIEVS